MMELLTHGGEHHEIGDGGWLMMTTVMNPSPLFFSPRKQIYRFGVEVGGAPGGPRGRGARPGGQARPHPRGQVVGPLALILSPIFLLFPKIISVKFQVIPRTFVSAQR